MKISMYDKDGYVGGDVEDEQAILMRWLVGKIFLPTRGTCPQAWLFFDTESGSGCGCAVGNLALKPGARRTLWKEGLGVHRIPTTLHPVLLDAGPEALKWDGTKIVVDGH